MNNSRFLNVDCCDFCFQEYHNNEKNYKDIKKSEYRIELVHKTIHMCKEHALILRDALVSDEIKLFKDDYL